MQVGVGIFATDETIAVREVGQLTEERGFESLWLPEHTHIPVSRETPYPAGTELPREYSRTLDPFVAHAAVAGATGRLKLGFGVCLLMQRDPIVTAKEVATLDLLSGGRVLFGVGAGWNVEEMRNHGTDPARRFGLLRERVEAMRAIWGADEAEYHGRHVDFEPIWSWPKPIQRPPPVLVGGNGRGVLDRVLAFGDAWLPNHLGDDESMKERIVELQRRAKEEKGVDRVPVTLFSAPPDPERLKPFGELGVTRVVFWLPPAPRDPVVRKLDRLAPLIEALA